MYLYVSCFQAMDLWTSFCKAKHDGTCSEASFACLKKKKTNHIKIFDFFNTLLRPCFLEHSV